METKSLANLVDNMNQVVTQIIEMGGELTPEMETLFDGAAGDLATKADSYAFAIDRLEKEAEFWKAKADALSKVARSCLQLQDRLRTNMKGAMLQMGTTEMRGNEYRFALSKMQPKVTVDETVLSIGLQKQTINYTPDLPLIRAKLEAGEHIPGAWLEEVVALRKYISKGNK